MFAKRALVVRERGSGVRQRQGCGKTDGDMEARRPPRLAADSHPALSIRGVQGPAIKAIRIVEVRQPVKLRRGGHIGLAALVQSARDDVREFGERPVAIADWELLHQRLNDASSVIAEQPAICFS